MFSEAVTEWRPSGREYSKTLKPRQRWVGIRVESEKRKEKSWLGLMKTGECFVSC